MSVLENPEAIRKKTVDNRNIGIPLKVFRGDYCMYPEGKDYDRRTAYILAENVEAAAKLIQSSIAYGTRFDWESMPSLYCEIHAVTESLQKALFKYLKKKYEGPSAGDKLSKIKR